MAVAFLELHGRPYLFVFLLSLAAIHKLQDSASTAQSSANGAVYGASNLAVLPQGSVSLKWPSPHQQA